MRFARRISSRFFKRNRSPIHYRGINESDHRLPPPSAPSRSTRRTPKSAFQVRHLVTRVRGHFTDFSGTIQFDEAHPEQASLTFTINAASIDTGTPDRDAHLRGEDFFAADKYPQITFTSARVTKKSG